MLERFPLVMERGSCLASVEALTSKLTFGRGSSGLLPNARTGNRAVNPMTSTWIQWQCILERRGGGAAWQAVLWEWEKENRATWHLRCITLEPLEHQPSLELAGPLRHRPSPRGKHVVWRGAVCFNKCLPIPGRRRMCLPVFDTGLKTLIFQIGVFLCSALLPASWTTLVYYWKLKWYLCFSTFLRQNVQKSQRST